MSKYYDASADQVIEEVKSNRFAGLTRRKAKARLKRDGKNIVFPTPQGFFREYLFHMLTDFTSVLLLLTALICLIFRHDFSAVVIAGTIVFSYLLCALVFLRAQKVLENMGSFALPVVKLMREERLFMARSEQIVRGDIIFLCAGDVVPADARLIESDHLILDESRIAAGSSVYKDAEFVAASGLDTGSQKNMVFASTVVLSGSAKAVVVTTGAGTVVCKMRRNAPIVSHEKLRVLERLRKICGGVGVGMLILVFALTVISLFLGSGLGLFENMLTFLSLAVASMSELYMAFGYMIVACGVFGALRQYKDINAGALIKNSSKLDQIKRISCIVAPKDGVFLVDELSLSQVYYDDVLYGVGDAHFPEGCGRILKLAVISTGIYGGKNLVSINSAGRNVFTTEENAIICCAQEHSLYNYNLDKEFQLLDHVSAQDHNPYDTTLVHTDSSNMVVVRGDALSLVEQCTHRRKGEESVILGTADTNELLLAANRMSIGGYRVCAVATKETGVIDLTGLSRAQARLTLEGFVLFKETLLPDAVKQIRACADAGIKVIMTTDTISEAHRYTARALGVIKNDDEILSAEQFAQMDEGVLVADIRSYSVYEGLSARQRRKLVDLLKKAGESVAYLGSSVDESAVVSDADVGYSQSVTLSARADKGGVDTLDKNIPILLKSARDGAGRGCDALKLTSDVIVSAADSSGGGGFNAIVQSIRVAKSVYENLFHMLSYLVCAQIARLLLVIASVFSGAFPFAPVQIVVSGLIVDFAAVVVFAFDRPRSAILGEAVGYDDRFLHPLRHLLPSLIYGLIWALITAVTGAVGILFGIPGNTVIFVSFLLTQMVFLAEFRCEGSIIRSGKGFNNIFALTLACLIAFLLLTRNLPAVSLAFGMEYGAPYAWLLSLIPPVLLLVSIEIRKLILWRKQHPAIKRKRFAHFKGKKQAMPDLSAFEQTGAEQQNPTAEYEDDPLPERAEVPGAEKQMRELVRLSVLCALSDWNPAGQENFTAYEEIADTAAGAIHTDSTLEVIAAVLIAALGDIPGVGFDDCVACAGKIKEYMEL